MNKYFFIKFCLSLLCMAGAGSAWAQTFRATHDPISTTAYSIGQTIAFKSAVASEAAATSVYNVETLILNAAGQKIASKYFYNQSLSTTAKPYAYSHLVTASMPAGTYRYAVWVWRRDWSRTFPVSQTALTFTVSEPASSAAALSVVTSGSHAGNVASTPVGIDCGADCSHSYATGTTVTLRATPQAGHAFSGWEGACAGSSPTCTVSMSAARTVNAVFNATPVKMYGLAINKQSTGTAGGTVTSELTGINCGATCIGNFYKDAKVLLKAAPVAGSLFAGWTGECWGVAATCLVNMTSIIQDGTDVTGTRTVNAIFVPQGSSQTLSINIDNPAFGRVNSSVGGLICSSANCRQTVGAGTDVKLTATAATGYYFVGWRGGLCAGSGTSCSVRVVNGADVFADFAAIDPLAHAPHIDASKLLPPVAGSSSVLISSAVGSELPTLRGNGDFRTGCPPYSHMNYDDPIYYPGQVGRAHLHLFFGNTGANANSTTSSLLNSGNSTCLGGIANRSAYWVPAMIDTRTGTPVRPVEAVFYYKSGGIPGRFIKPFPQGLRMVAGNHLKNKQQAPDAPISRFTCDEFPMSHDGQSLPDCPAGRSVIQQIFFPQCWDGVNLDSPDHKSHMAYPIASSCPPSHPVAVPQITFNIHYPVNETNETRYWRLSSDHYSDSLRGGFSSHGDWWNGWRQDVLETWIKHCNNAEVDCHSMLMGDGRALN